MINKEKKVAAIQSSYIPWKGYFDIIQTVDEFILYDDVQYTPKNWRNRNRMKTPQGLKWLSIPVSADESIARADRFINKMRATNHDWPDQHWSFIQANYARARHFDAQKDNIKDMFMEAKDIDFLSDINMHFIKRICNLLDIDTEIRFSTDYVLTKSGKSERPLELAIKAGADVFVSGGKASEYYDLEAWSNAGVKVDFFSYDGYKEYWQPYPPFEHSVSILDLLFNTGDDAKNYLLSTPKNGIMR